MSVVGLDKLPVYSCYTEILTQKMNEICLLIQVFGMGLYDYYQYVRMKEASRLLRDEKLTVSETGYRLGFDNMSHFSRVFEKHIGKKPKKYSKDFAI